MRGSALVGLACAAAGCVPIDPYRGPSPEDAAPARELVGLSVMGSGNERIEVRGEQFMVGFPGITAGPEFPDTIELGGMSVLGEDEACEGDDRVGIRLIPAFTSTRIANTFGPTLDITREGEAHVRAELVWEFTYTCDGAQQVARGTARFSFFPDGRIVRYDNVSPSSVTLATGGPTGCGCLSGSAPSFYWLQSHIALTSGRFARYHFARIDAPTLFQAGPLPVPPGAGETLSVTSPNPIWACLGPELGASGPYAGIVWTTPSPGTTEDNGTRIKPHSAGGEETTIFIWDWLYAKFGSNAVSPGPYETIATWHLGIGDDAMCDGPLMQARNDAFNDPATVLLVWNGGSGSDSVELDRADGVYHWAPSPAPLAAPRFYDVRSDRPIPTSHAISVLLPGPSAPAVLKNGRSLRQRYDYLWQAVEEPPTPYYRHTLWFPTAWDSTEDLVTITQ